MTDVGLTWGLFKHYPMTDYLNLKELGAYELLFFILFFGKRPNEKTFCPNRFGAALPCGGSAILIRANHFAPFRGCL